MSHFAALDSFLRPFKNIFMEDGVSEVMVNQPKEVWIENRGEFRLEKIPELEYDHLIGLARLVAQSTDQMISEEKPLLSASLPNGYRIQIIFPPAVESGNVAMSIRKGSQIQLTLEDYEKMGAFVTTKTAAIEDKNDIILNDYLKNNRIKDCLHHAVICKKIL